MENLSITELLLLQNPGLFRQGQIGATQLLKVRLQRPGSCHHHNIPAGLEHAFVEAVNLPEAAADPVADAAQEFFAATF